jgi:hypothetical protein
MRTATIATATIRPRNLYWNRGILIGLASSGGWHDQRTSNTLK